MSLVEKRKTWCAVGHNQKIVIAGIGKEFSPQVSNGISGGRQYYIWDTLINATLATLYSWWPCARKGLNREYPKAHQYTIIARTSILSRGISPSGHSLLKKALCGTVGIDQCCSCIIEFTHLHRGVLGKSPRPWKQVVLTGSARLNNTTAARGDNELAGIQ